MLKHFGIDTSRRGVEIRFGGDLTAVSGIGASAAQVVSLSRAIGIALNQNLTEEEVNAAGYEANSHTTLTQLSHNSHTTLTQLSHNSHTTLTHTFELSTCHLLY